MSESRDPMFGLASQRASGRDMLILQNGMLTMKRKKSLIIIFHTGIMMTKKEKAKQNMKAKAETLMMLSLTCSRAYSVKGSTMNQWRP